jgi:cellobiose phosphorylase
MKDGFFDKDGREYVITNPNLGRPWINFLTNARYGVCLSHTGGGFSMFNQELRVSHYDPRYDEPGKWVYVRDDDTGRFWSLTWAPVKARPTRFRCRVGMGYTVFESENQGIRGVFRVFVPREDPVEIWTVTLKNVSRRKRRISAYPFFAWKLIGFIRQDNVHEWFSQADYRPGERAVIGEYFDPHDLNRTYEGFFHSELKHHGYTCSGQKFRGTFYNGWANPLAIKNGELGNARGYAEQTIACLRHKMVLRPGGQKTFSIVAGFSGDPRGRRRLIRKYHGTRRADAAFSRVRKYFDSLVSTVSVKTPSATFDLFTNVWLKAQVYVMANWKSRGGSFRNGFRDTLQDGRAVLSLYPRLCRDLLLEALKYQYPDGHCLRQWSASGDHDYRYYIDSPYWIVFALARYIRETGDFSILKRKVPYFSGPGLLVKKGRQGKFTEKQVHFGKKRGTVWEHAVLAMRHLFAMRGRRGLCLFGWGDINDAMDLCGRRWKGESVWMTQAFYFGLKDMITLAGVIGKKKVQREFRKMAGTVAGQFNRHAWDGRWFVRGWTDTGAIMGSRKNREGAIHLLPQSWAAISGISSKSRTARALLSVRQKLYCAFGPKLFAPMYKRRDPDIGQMTALRGHMNNNPYTHHAIQLIQAYTALGMGDRALELFNMVLPEPRPGRKPPRGFRTAASEPYTISNYYVADDDPEGRGGEAGQGWLTASAGWLFIAAIEHIMGVRPSFWGLRIDPCFPAAWKRASIVRPFRGHTFHIEFKNPKGVQKDVRSITVDGRPVKGDIIPLPKKGKTHRVCVEMG